MALTKNVELKFAVGRRTDIGLPVAADQKIYRGAALELNAGGFLEPASGAGTFAGIALDQVDSTGLANGDLVIRVAVECLPELTITTDAITAASVGAIIEAEDDNTFRVEPGSAITGQTVGKVVRVIDAAAKRVLVLAQSAYMRSV